MIRFVAYLNDFFFSRFGFFVTNSNRNFRHVLNILLRSNKTTVVIDIGGSYGQYGKLIRRGGYRGLIYSFEPLVEDFKILQDVAKSDGMWSTHNFAIGESISSTKLYVAGNNVSSSILPMMKLHEDEAPGSSYRGYETIKCITLDSFMKSINLLPSDLLHIKIDVQGFERHVLEGAKELLSNPKVRSVEIELSTAELYLGQADWVEITNTLRELEFELFSISGGFFESSTSRLLQFDAIFAREAIS
jgi:FkbM family methyltransferase